MQTNRLPAYDGRDNPTGCCPRFNPDGWDNRKLHFVDKLFVRVTTTPASMTLVFEATYGAIETARAFHRDNVIVLSRELPDGERCEHFFAVTKPVPGLETVSLTGDYQTKVFEGPFEDRAIWLDQLAKEVAKQDKTLTNAYFFHTTCPSCAAAYGKNVVVAVGEVTGT